MEPGIVSQVSSAFGRRSADVRGDANICYGGRRLIARDFKAVRSLVEDNPRLRDLHS